MNVKRFLKLHRISSTNLLSYHSTNERKYKQSHCWCVFGDDTLSMYIQVNFGWLVKNLFIKVCRKLYVLACPHWRQLFFKTLFPLKHLHLIWLILFAVIIPKETKQVTLCKKECLKFHNVFLSHNPNNEGKYSKSHCRCYFWDDTLSM